MTMTMTTTTTDHDAVTPGRHRWPSLGIRARIVVGYVALLAAALSISIVVTRQVLHSRLDRQINQALAQEIEELRLLAGGIDPATGDPFGEDVVAIFDTFLARSVPADNEAFYTLVAGRPYLRSFDAPPELFADRQVVAGWAAATEPLIETIETQVGTARTLAVPLLSGDDPRGTFAVAYFPGPERAEIGQILRLLLLAGGIVLAASALLAWSLAGRVLRPVRDLTATARTISDTDLSARIPVDGSDELAELGRTFNEMLDRLGIGFEQQRRFLDDVAHELRTPITIARGHLDLLGDTPEERDETVAIVTDELDRMGRYVTDLLLLAKTEHPDFLQLRPVDLAEWATTTLRSLSALADRAWTLDHTVPAGTTIDADPGRLSQAVLNLATNAVQHTRDGDVIALGVMVDDGPASSARIWIRDTGDGIDVAAASSLFQRNARGATSRTTRPDGMGIGLSIVDAIARAHGGRVGVDGQRGEGARFEIRLPARTVPPPAVLPAPDPTAVTPDRSPAGGPIADEEDHTP
jgi:two-component system, OmpR family, sensor kinase